jgi:hypothetical protein
MALLHLNFYFWKIALASALGNPLAGRLMEQTHLRYKHLVSQIPDEANTYQRQQLVNMILPGLALYQALLNDGFESQKAVEYVSLAFTAQYQRYRQILKLFGTLPFFYSFIRQSLRQNFNQTLKGGFKQELVEDSPRRLAWMVYECFALFTLKQHQAGELITAFCLTDDVLLENLSPHVRWQRTQTLGRGGPYCDFCWWNTHPPKN